MLTLFQLPSSVLVACYPLTHHLVSYFVLLTTCFGCLLHFFAACTKSQVYIEALVPYRIDRVLILIVRFINISWLPAGEWNQDLPFIFLLLISLASLIFMPSISLPILTIMRS